MFQPPADHGPGNGAAKHELTVSKRRIRILKPEAAPKCPQDLLKGKLVTSKTSLSKSGNMTVRTSHLSSQVSGGFSALKFKINTPRDQEHHFGTIDVDIRSCGFKPAQNDQSHHFTQMNQNHLKERIVFQEEGDDGQSPDQGEQCVKSVPTPPIVEKKPGTASINIRTLDGQSSIPACPRRTTQNLRNATHARINDKLDPQDHAYSNPNFEQSKKIQNYCKNIMKYKSGQIKNGAGTVRRNLTHIIGAGSLRDHT